jgi:hypothetical protein
MTTADTSKPDIAIFPDLNIVIRTPAGREYRGKVLMHDSQHAEGESWMQVMNLRTESKEQTLEGALLAQSAHKHGRPSYFPAESTVEPLRLHLNRIPTAKRNEKNADTLIGELWDADGLWTCLIKPSKSDSLLFAGSALPAKCEVENNPGSKIAQFRRPTAPGETPVEVVYGVDGQKPGNG